MQNGLCFRIRNLRFLSVSRLPQPYLAPNDFLEFGGDLEELQVINSNLAVIKNHAFHHTRSLKTLNLSENKITQLESEAFTEVSLAVIRTEAMLG